MKVSMFAYYVYQIYNEVCISIFKSASMFLTHFKGSNLYFIIAKLPVDLDEVVIHVKLKSLCQYQCAV